MPVNVGIKILSFGQIRLEIGKSISLVEERRENQVREGILYREPQETASRIYEVQYDEDLMNYIVPLSTG
jgi:hypothetical protein